MYLCTSTIGATYIAGKFWISRKVMSCGLRLDIVDFFKLLFSPEIFMISTYGAKHTESQRVLICIS